MIWEFVGNIKGADGENIELRTNSTHIQWKPVSSETWIDLIELSALKGPKGDKGDKGDSGDGNGGGGDDPTIPPIPQLWYEPFGEGTPELTARDDDDNLIRIFGEESSVIGTFMYILTKYMELEDSFNMLLSRYNERFGESDWMFSPIPVEGVDVLDSGVHINRSEDNTLYFNYIGDDAND